MHVAAPLSLPEAYVLLVGARADAHEIVFLALVELVERGALNVIQVPGGEMGECAFGAVDPGRAHARPLAALARAIADAAEEQGGARIDVPTADVRSRFVQRWGAADRFARDEVWRSLAERGLASLRPNPLDALFAVHSFHLTEEGEQERARLRSALADVSDWPSRPATALLAANGLAVPGDDTFDAIDELEDLITPGDLAGDNPDVGPSFTTPH
jgi:hypothetical protein